MARYAHIASALHARIRHGDYRLQEFPTVSKLAVELGVNPRTIYKAMDELHRGGVLERLDTGRYTVRESDGTDEPRLLHVALIMPAFPSMGMLRVHRHVDRCVEERDWRLRAVNYVHWNDPVIAGSLRGFDASFFIADSGAGEGRIVPDHLVSEIQTCGRPVVSLLADLSVEGIPSLQFVSPAGITPVLDVLLPTHRRIAYLNIQPHGGLTDDRLGQWSLWTKVNGIEPQLFDQPVEPGESPMLGAHQRLCAIIRAGKLTSSAIFCSTGASAVGAIRALSDCGIEPGRDIAVCAADGEGELSTMLRPTLTCFKATDSSAYIDLCLEWFGSGKPWAGPLLVRPAQVPVFVGESTSTYRAK